MLGIMTKMRQKIYGIKKYGKGYIIPIKNLGKLYTESKIESVAVFNLFQKDIPFKNSMDIYAQMIKNKVVVDVGANMGDTLLFANKFNAKFIYAYEPNLISFNCAVKTTFINKINNAKVYWNGIAGHDRTLKISSTEPPMAGYELKNKKNGDIEVKLITLEDIVNQHKIQDAVLKLDCEGYEYEIIESSPKNIIRIFSDIYIEYHNKPERLINRLKKIGYWVFYYDNSQLNNKKYGEVGYMFAKRIDIISKKNKSKTSYPIIKDCQICDKTIYKNPRESWRRFNNRKYCSIKCSRKAC